MKEGREEGRKAKQADRQEGRREGRREGRKEERKKGEAGRQQTGRTLLQEPGRYFTLVEHTENTI